MNAADDLSFLPDDYLENKARRRSNVLCAGLFAVTLLGVGAAFAFTQKTTHEMEEMHAEVSARYTEAARRIQQVQQMQSRQRTLAQQAELASSLVEKVPRSFLLAELTNALPAGVSLVDFSLDSRLVAPPAPKPMTALDQRAAGPTSPPAAAPKLYDVSMKITGVAYNDLQVAQLIASLNRSKLLSEVNLVVTETFKLDDETLRRFQIELVLDPGAKVDPIGTKAKTVAMQIGSAR